MRIRLRAARLTSIVAGGTSYQLGILRRGIPSRFIIAAFTENRIAPTIRLSCEFLTQADAERAWKKGFTLDHSELPETTLLVEALLSRGLAKRVIPLRNPMAFMLRPA
jgi:hypothetical protein